MTTGLGMSVLALLCMGVVLVSGKYTLHVNTDGGTDLLRPGTASFDELSKLCDATQNCEGFSTDGYLKTMINSTAPSLSVSLWVKAQGNSPPAQPSALWPLPQHYTSGSEKAIISPAFTFQTNVASSTLKKAFLRYTDLIFDESFIQDVGLRTMMVHVVDDNEALSIDTDESYSLEVNSTYGVIKAQTIYGAMHALETFSQLVAYDFDADRYLMKNSPWSIQDFPVFPHRGVLIDTSRHWLPPKTIRDIIDSLSYAKMNVLHWHIVDAQSFPVQSNVYPKLWEGSWSPRERYTLSTIAQIVQYAKERGVRVMPEFDGPGHAWAWGVGYPSLLPEGYAKSSACASTCPINPCDVPLDPVNEFTYKLLGGLYEELTGGRRGAGVFSDDFFHLGGDEVEYECWNGSTSIRQYMLSHNKTFDNLYEDFITRTHDIIIANGRTPVNWEEVFNHFGTKLNPKTVIHIWLDHATLQKVVAAGYRGILSNYNDWYLDNLNTDWSTYYLNDPYEQITDPQQRKLVLGGQSCMWGEDADPSDEFSRIWPKSAAVAERLWNYHSANLDSAVELAEPRLGNFRCHLIRRGINSAPVFSAAPFQPGSCMWT